MTRIPKHIGIIPDGNRRWALGQGLAKEDGYDHGISPGLELFYICRDLGVEELTFYGFTVDNTKRPSAQRVAFSKACVRAVECLSRENARLLVLGNTSHVSQGTASLYHQTDFRNRRYESELSGKLQFSMGSGIQKRSLRPCYGICRRVPGGPDHPLGRKETAVRLSPCPVRVCRHLCDRRLLA